MNLKYVYSDDDITNISVRKLIDDELEKIVETEDQCKQCWELSPDMRALRSSFMTNLKREQIEQVHGLENKTLKLKFFMQPKQMVDLLKVKSTNIIQSDKTNDLIIWCYKHAPVLDLKSPYHIWHGLIKHHIWDWNSLGKLGKFTDKEFKNL